MTIRLAINGFGRIGRMVLRALFETPQTDLMLVAINSTESDPLANAHLIQYDSTHGRFPHRVQVENNALNIQGQSIRLFSTRNPAELPWQDLGVDVVLECTGKFNSKAKSQVHIEAGAKKVLLSAPGAADVDATIVYGVNHAILKPSDVVVSAASCTTNGLAPMLAPLQEHIGIEQGLMNTIHAYTNDQSLLDAHHSDWRRARGAGQSLIPSKTGAATAIGLIIPALAGKLNGFAIRVPVANVSLVDVTFIAQRPTSKEEIHHIIQTAAQSGPLAGILAYNDAPLVSVDFNHTVCSSYFDATLTQVSADGRLVKVCAWYDNEWGFSCRMLDVARAMMKI